MRQASFKDAVHAVLLSSHPGQPTRVAKCDRALSCAVGGAGGAHGWICVKAKTSFGALAG
jgi:hypothetical protein